MMDFRQTPGWQTIQGFIARNLSGTGLLAGLVALGSFQPELLAGVIPNAVWDFIKGFWENKSAAPKESDWERLLSDEETAKDLIKALSSIQPALLGGVSEKVTVAKPCMQQ